MDSKPAIFECAIKTRPSGKWPPDFSALAAAGFDKVSVSKTGAIIRKVHGTDFSGKPHLSTEIEIRRDSVVLRSSYPQQSDAGVRNLQAFVMLLRVLRLVPGIQADLQSLCAHLLPPMEKAAHMVSEPYEKLSKKHADLQADHFELSSKSKRLLHASEENAHAALELERQISALQSRIKKLEAVPDEPLCELVLDWLSSHRGQFSLPQFSKVNGIPAARCEEGLEMLLKEGAIRRIGSGFSVQKTDARSFEVHNTGSNPLKKLSSMFSKKS